MTEESSEATHLSVAMTTEEVAKITGEDSVMSSSSSERKFYFRCVCIILGIIGTAANGLILYALVASKQHKKHVLIVNQNAFDLFSSVSLIVTYAVKISDVPMVGTLGYWVCMILLSEKLIWCGIIGSVINLAIITIERYLKIVHVSWSKKRLRRWVIYLAMAFAWIAAIVYNIAVVFPTSSVTGGACNTYAIWKNETAKLILFVYKLLSFYVIILVICIFCYSRILVAIRRQAKVMAGHSAAGPSTNTGGQTQANKQIKSSIIKTMIFVSAFYAVSWLPTYVYLLLVNLNPDLPILDIGYYTAEFISWFYICTNPFIYAAKFKPVKKILLGMMPCKTAGQGDEIAETDGGTFSRAAHTRY